MFIAGLMTAPGNDLLLQYTFLYTQILPLVAFNLGASRLANAVHGLGDVLWSA